MGFSIYTAPGGFVAVAAGSDTEQAKTRPISFNGPATDKSVDKDTALRVGTVKYSPSESQFAAWSAEKDPAKRAAILATMTRKVMRTGKAQVTTAALATWQASVIAEAEALGIPAHEHAAAILAGGVIVLTAEAEDKTADVLSALFPEAD